MWAGLSFWGARGAALAAENEGAFWGGRNGGAPGGDGCAVWEGGGGYTWEKLLSAGQEKFRGKPQSGVGREVGRGEGGAGCFGKVWFWDFCWQEEPGAGKGHVPGVELQLGGVKGGDWQLVLSYGELQRAGFGTVGVPVPLHGKTLCLGEKVPGFEPTKCDRGR